MNDFSPVEWYAIKSLKRKYIAKHGGTIPVTDCDIFVTIMESTLDPNGESQHGDTDMEPIWLDALHDMIESHNEALND